MTDGSLPACATKSLPAKQSQFEKIDYELFKSSDSQVQSKPRISEVRARPDRKMKGFGDGCLEISFLNMFRDCLCPGSAHGYTHGCTHLIICPSRSRTGRDRMKEAPMDPYVDTHEREVFWSPPFHGSNTFSGALVSAHS